MAKLSSTHIYGDLYVDGTISGALSGNASTATTLQTARTINGTSFNGSANITTANWGTARNISIADSDATNTGTAVSVNGSGNVTLKLPATIKATLSGNAATATKATQDSAGQQINTTYIKGLSVSGKTITYTKGDGTTGTITTQDTNTTYSAATTSAAGLMSAADKTKLDGIATSANNYSHPNSGATAGSYGPSANASPAHSGTFSVPYITINAAGHITSASTKTITLPADNNTDTKVTYTLGTTTKYYMGGPTATATGTGGITFDTGIYATTTAGQLQVTGGLITGSTIKSDAAVTDDLGTGALPWRATYSKQFTVAGEASKTYGYLTTQTVGTADTVGVCRLSLGNSTASGTASNAKGHIHLYGSSSGYTNLTPGNNGTSNITITLPSATGSLPIMSKGDTSYWGMLTPDGGTSWIRTTSSGLIPVDQNGTSALGTSSWPFGSIYGTTIYEGGTSLANKYAAKSHGTHLTIGTGASNAAAGNHTHTNIFHQDTRSTNTTPDGAPTGLSVHLKNNGTDGLSDGGTYHSSLFIKGWNDYSGGPYGNIAISANNNLWYRASSSGSAWNSWKKVSVDGHSHSGYLSTGGGTLSGPITVSGESKFHNGTYSDPWSGTGCCIKGTGNMGLTGALRANSGVATLVQANGVATSDGATYVANLRYANSRGYCDLGSNTIPGRLYIRSGQGTAGSGVCVECSVTNGKAYVQYLSPEAGTIALTSHLSDRTKKDNITYVGSKDSEFTNKDFYDFIKKDLGLATYTIKKEYATTDTHTKLNFIAQDILYDYDNDCINKVGNLIVQTEDAMEQQGTLQFDPDTFASVIAGALKESINKIEEDNEKIKILENEIKELEIKNKALEELVYSINERLLNLEDNI